MEEYTIHFFWCEKCPNCDGVKEILKDLDLEFEEHDIDTPEGTSSALFYKVMATPTIVVANKEDKTILSWTGAMMPTKDNIKIGLKNIGILE